MFEIVRSDDRPELMRAHQFLLFVSLVLMIALGIRLFADAPEGSLAPADAPSRPAATARGPEPGQVLAPLPPAPTLPAARVALGERLFFDRRLSHDNSVACASCHDIAQGGTDRATVSTGIRGQQGQLNAPTVFNTGLNVAQFWDGRATSLTDQVAGPVHNPVEMGSNWNEVLAKLLPDQDLKGAFAEAYPEGLTAANVADAIATYEQSLVTPNSRFDRFLTGDQTALNAQERQGYRRFMDYGCSSCHQGAGVGGNMFQRFGVMGNYFKDRAPAPRDLGRFNVTGLEADRHVFKVPSLRNVAVTAPYFHDGSAATLEQAIAIMAKYQLGREVSPDEQADIAAFLRTLTGQWQGKTLQ